MKIALFADLHANLEATEACLAHARGAGATRHAFLGDLVGYGPDPGAVVDLVAALAPGGARVVCGNHDVAAAGRAAPAMHPAAAAAVEWTRARLTAGQRGFLAALPAVVREGDLLLVHASADAPEAWTYVSDAAAAERSLAAAGSARYVVAGHVHEPALYHAGASGRPVRFRPVPGVCIPVPPHRRWLAVAGAVGQPRDGNRAAAYALLDLAAATLTFWRVPYDWAAVAAKVRAAGLPESLAARLEHGR